MTSFRTTMTRVLDPAMAPEDRRRALRRCVSLFAPYGFSATWCHLVDSADIPREARKDPDSLVTAVQELAEAKALWVSFVDAETPRRRVEKAAGRRRPHPLAVPVSYGSNLAYCPFPLLRPEGSLPDVVGRVLGAVASRVDWRAVCLACGAARPAARTCVQCGVDARGPRCRADPVFHEVSRAVWAVAPWESWTKRSGSPEKVELVRQIVDRWGAAPH